MSLGFYSESEDERLNTFSLCPNSRWDRMDMGLDGHGIGRTWDRTDMGFLLGST